MPEMPHRIAALPRRGATPVPWFVHVADGVPDFRIIRRGAVQEAVRRKVCWICGQKLGRYLSFILGPAGVINRVTSEPPSHLECAIYAVETCPFIANPNAKRRDEGKPLDVVMPDGLMEHNPGGAIIWVTRNYWVTGHLGAELFYPCEPTSVGWYSGGQPATRKRAAELIADALRHIRPVAEKEGEISLRGLFQRVADAHSYLPDEEPDAG